MVFNEDASHAEIYLQLHGEAHRTRKGLRWACRERLIRQLRVERLRKDNRIPRREKSVLRFH